MRYSVALVVLLAAAAQAGQLATGNALGCEHVAFVRAGVVGGLVGPARECAAGDNRDIRCCLAPDGAIWVPDSRDCLVYRIKDGQARIVAGCGVKGYRDGPADRAMFDFGVGSYCDVETNCDAAGNIYVSDMMNNAIRRIFRKQESAPPGRKDSASETRTTRPDGTWWVETVSGGGKKGREPKKGEWIPASELRFGGASRFAVADDGTLFFANYGGIYQVKEGKATRLATHEELQAQLGPKKPIADWHVGGSHITPDGVFYWVPGGQEIYRFDTKTGRAEIVAGEGPKQTDAATVRESGFHTVDVVYSRDASVIYTGGGDESVPRRIHNGTVKHLQKDGTFKAGKEQDRDNWRLYQVAFLSPEGDLYTFCGIYAWAGWLVKVRFAKE
ncbi:MAG: hypothetical protein FJ290_28570 [Planctomycetes bacterium]|nr:hypothetical protein [Planctomycetota bacterium]